MQEVPPLGRPGYVAGYQYQHPVHPWGLPSHGGLNAAHPLHRTHQNSDGHSAPQGSAATRAQPPSGWGMGAPVPYDQFSYSAALHRSAYPHPPTVYSGGQFMNLMRPPSNGRVKEGEEGGSAATGGASDSISTRDFNVSESPTTADVSSVSDTSHPKQVSSSTTRDSQRSPQRSETPDEWDPAEEAAASNSDDSTTPTTYRKKPPKPTPRRRGGVTTVVDPVTGSEVVIKPTRTKQSLEQRERVKQGKRVYECPFCDRIFSCSSNLIRHKRVHTGDKP